jgi:DNA-binding NtrC family response regulator
MSHRILIVEDETVVLNFARTVLQNSGHEVLAAQSVTEARDILSAQVPFENLCLLVDVVLDGESGIAFAQEVVRHHPASRVLLMSGFTDDVLLGEPDLAERIGFLRKPFTRRELLSAVDSVCTS